ncbi:MAG: L-threonine 3-dehydrogenase [Bdellovibrionales bacterium GWA2_49_15]|nr:MAG: L-threonine 3-dehydrogenase [Bdellovibrionales bacterium GWA2_49_15]HAZ14260.1 L-threonine 3-dehydrogenase [Bdellovibrionales bacterium]
MASQRMKALVKKYNRPGLWMDEVEIPVIGIDDVLIKIHKTAICGTDIHIYNWDEWAQKTIPVPMVVGHEYVGTIAAVGANVKGFEIGEVVSGEGHIVCGHCRNCRAGRRHLCMNTLGVGVNRQGAFAEFLSIPASNVWRCDPSIHQDVLACFDPFGNAVHTTLSYDLVGEDVLITGAGPIGIMAVAIARHAGARHVVITDVNPYRLALAKKMGATRAVNVKEEKLSDVIRDLKMTEGFDVGLEMSGNVQAFQEMIAHMVHGGKIALLGILPNGTGIDWDKVVFNSLNIKGIYGREMFETWYQMTVLTQSGLDISPVITHRFPVNDFEKGFELMKSGQSGKIILNWT